eukprot:GHUV01038473.1.p2 GENE.GHUV01038473.1~~GHUV01038473.1.p2  ORF type:complete len:114 (+),score=21.20 GHUV01038473.1:397-738(+)
MERPKRQTRKPGKYDDEFIIPAEAAEMYWEANTRKVYRFLTDKDIKSSLKDTTVYILWPGDGKWYLAEVDEVRGKCSTQPAAVTGASCSEQRHLSHVDPSAGSATIHRVPSCN